MYNDGALTFAYLEDLEYWDIIIADLLMLRSNGAALCERATILIGRRGFCHPRSEGGRPGGRDIKGKVPIFAPYTHFLYFCLGRFT